MLFRATLWLLAAAVVPFVAITRAEACTYSISPTTVPVPAAGATVSVTITTQSACYWMLGLGAAWMKPVSGFEGYGNGQSTFSVLANTSTAQRTAQVIIGDQYMTVTQAGASTCTYSLSAPSYSAASTAGQSTVSVTSQSGCAWTAAVQGTATWLHIASGASGTGNGTVTFSFDANTGAARSGTMLIAGQTFTVNQAAGAASGPAPTLGGVGNAADGAASFAPGMIISLYGSNFATAVNLASTIPLPNSLSGISVEVLDGSQVLNAPLFFVSPLQINAQLPFNMISSSVQVRVRNAQGVSNAQTITITPRCPRLFTKTMDGKGEAVVVHADAYYTVVSANWPASPGETLILFLTGLGAVSPSVSAGQAGGDGTPGKPLNLVSGVTVTVGGTSTYVSFSGLAPGFAGLYQVNFQVPTGAAGPLANIVVSAGSQASQGAVAFAVGSKNAQSLGSATVGTQGGTVSAGPVTLTVPSGAFSSSATINVSRVTGGATTDPSAFGDTYALTGVPASTAGSMTVAIQPSGALPSGAEPYIVVTESDGGSLYVQAQVQGNLVTATLPPRPGTSASGSGNASHEALSLPVPRAADSTADQLILDLILVKSSLSEEGHFRILCDLGKAIADSIGHSFEQSFPVVTSLGLANTPKIPITVRATGFGQKLREPWGEAGLTWGSTYTRFDTDWTPPRGYWVNVAAPELMIHAVLAPNRPQNVSLEQTRWLEEALAAACERWVFPITDAGVFMPPQVDPMFRKDWTGEIPFEVGMGDDQSAAHGYVESMFMDYLVNLRAFPDGSPYLPWSWVGSIYKYPSNIFTPMAALKAAVKPLSQVWQNFAENMAQNWFYQSDYSNPRWSVDQRRAMKLSIVDVASHNQQTLSTTPISLNWSAGGLAAKFFLINLDKNVQWTSNTDLAVHLLSSTGALAYVYGATPSTGEIGTWASLINDRQYVAISPSSLQSSEALLVAIVNPNTGASGTITVTLTPEGFTGGLFAQLKAAALQKKLAMSTYVQFVLAGRDQLQPSVSTQIDYPSDRYQALLLPVSAGTNTLSASGDVSDSPECGSRPAPGTASMSVTFAADGSTISGMTATAQCKYTSSGHSYVSTTTITYTGAVAPAGKELGYEGNGPDYMWTQQGTSPGPAKVVHDLKEDGVMMPCALCSYTNTGDYTFVIRMFTEP